MNRIQEIINNSTTANTVPNYVQIAKDIGTTTNTLYKWRKNEVQPNMKYLPRIASVLGVSINELIKE